MTDNSIKEAFNEIKADDALKQKTIDTVLAKTNQRPFPMKMVLTAALILITVIGGIFSYTTPVYAISLDDTSSIELHVNMYQRVVSVTSYSSTGTVSVTNMDYQDAVEKILNDASWSSQNVTITIAGNNQAGCQKMAENLQNCSSQCMGSASYITADADTIAQAKACGMSLGKYKAYLLLKEADPTITLEQAQNMTMQEIHQMISKCAGMGQMKKHN